MKNNYYSRKRFTRREVCDNSNQLRKSASFHQLDNVLESKDF